MEYEKYSYLTIIIIIASIFNNVYAERIITVYLCELDNGSIGYYDLPCSYKINFKSKLLSEPKLVKQKILNLKPYDYKIFNKNRVEIINNIKNVQNNTLTHDLELVNQRCHRASIKFPYLIELLKSEVPNSENYIKIKRSAFRYKRILKKYCHKNTSNV